MFEFYIDKHVSKYVCVHCFYYETYLLVWIVVEKAESHWLGPSPNLQVRKLKEADNLVFLFEVAYLTSGSLFLESLWSAINILQSPPSLHHALAFLHFCDQELD